METNETEITIDGAKVDDANVDDAKVDDSIDTEATPEPESESEITTGPEPEAQPETAGTVTVDIARLIEEAEHRGYLRGRNEIAAEMLNRPGLYDEEHSNAVDGFLSDGTPVTILNNLRRSVWDD